MTYLDIRSTSNGNESLSGQKQYSSLIERGIDGSWFARDDCIGFPRGLRDPCDMPCNSLASI